MESSETESGAYVFREESLLGTRAQFHFTARNYFSARAAASVVLDEVDRLNSILNTRDPSSEISLLNRNRLHLASPELFAVVALAEQWRVESGGAYSGRLGKLIERWSDLATTPSRSELAILAREAGEAHVRLNRESRAIERPAEVVFALDGVAKGWIVDRAFEKAMSCGDVHGALIDIGGDIRCGGRGPDAGWIVGVPDPHLPFDNAPLVETVRLRNEAIATSGLGPRDRMIDGIRYSPTLSPRDGWPIEHHASVSAIAATAADADAIATALLVMKKSQARQFADARGISARIASAQKSVVLTRIAQADFKSTATAKPQSTPQPWQPGWQALATFTAPRRQLIRDPDFRSPYMAMWITDLDNKPIRTLILVGKRSEWQRDNFIWWSINRDNTDRLVSTRSMSTSGAGVYNVFWDGVNDVGEVVPAGKYLLHVETSRERGKHTYRSLELNFDEFKRFSQVLPPTEEGGGLKVSVDHY